MEKVRVWEEEVVIPTYGTGEPEKNPIFSDKRVYQGSSGKVYPYPVIEKIEDTKEDKLWKAIFLENQYMKIMILPELGGRIQRAYDKTNGYDFVYYNHVIKPALVGLTGPWISGGIEFNWPQHHRPTTFLPVEYAISEHSDGSKTVMVNDTDQMYGTKGIASFTLYPGKAYLEVKGQLYNRTPFPQTFLWWANPAVSVNDCTQSVFPPDVHAVMDHGKRDVSSFPIATGTYYKHDYSAGVDLSRYKNIPVPTSYMAEKSRYDFVGGYDYGKEAGILHVADHHISPGKKQWTWGCGEFGKAWDRNLTDADGPYIELMTGVFTDNQPDFSWMKPFEEKTFTQYFMPYKQIGYVKNASQDALVNLEFKGDWVEIYVYTTGEEKDAQVILERNGHVVFEETADISPTQIYKKSILLEAVKKTEMSLRIRSAEGRELVSYTPEPEGETELPVPAQAAKDPKEIGTCEELYLTGLHLEQYRHASYLPDDYYLEGLRRDPGDIRLNTAYGMLLLRRGLFKESEAYFRQAIKRMTWKNPNPYNSEAYYDLGLTLFYQDRMEEAYDVFYKATWSAEQKAMSFYFLAAIRSRQGAYSMALELLEQGLIQNMHNVKARALKAVILRKLGEKDQAVFWVEENLQLDQFDYLSAYEEILLSDEKMRSQKRESLRIKMRNFPQNFILAACDYMEGGFCEEALQILDLCTTPWPMIDYYRAFCQLQLGFVQEAQNQIRKADEEDPDYCFPNMLEDILVLEKAVEEEPDLPKVYYYLGDLWYDKRQYDRARTAWEQSASRDASFPIVLRNLSLVYYNQCGMPQEAKACLEKAFSLDTADARIFFELDQLYKKLSVPIEERLEFYECYPNTFGQRDDVFIEYITLQNLTENNEKAYDLLMGRKFHPWEGGEGKVTTQYKIALTELAKRALAQKDYKDAKRYLERALSYPENLGEGKLEGTRDNDIRYFLGLIARNCKDEDSAKKWFGEAGVGTEDPAAMMFYNDQPADGILFQGLALQALDQLDAARLRFHKLMKYGEEHQHDEVKMDYFAVSYPDLLIFNDDLTKRNQAHCCYLMGLGNLGLGNYQEAAAYFSETLKLDPYHQRAKIYFRDASALLDKH